MGAIDVELLADGGTASAANFLADVRSGLFDFNFFHRTVPNQLLQVGAFRLQGLTGREGVPVPGLAPASAPLADIEFPGPLRVVLADPDLPATIWTVSLTEYFLIENDAISSRLTLTFNLTDDPPEPQTSMLSASRIIGRVLPGDSRAVLSTISGLPLADYSPLQGDPASPLTFHLNSVPVLDTAALPADGLIRILDAELIKPHGVAAFYIHRSYMPEGFAASHTSDSATIFNPGTEDVAYQVILRFETGLRDLVLIEGVLGPGERTGIGRPLLWETRTGAFASELHSTAPLVASHQHRYNAPQSGTGIVEESYFDPSAFAPEQLLTWDFPGRPRQGTQFDFLLWQNTSLSDAALTITFFFDDAEPVTMRLTTPALRRGGLELFALPLLAESGEPVGARLESTQPIVAFWSSFVVVAPAVVNGEPLVLTHLRDLYDGTIDFPPHTRSIVGSGSLGTAGGGAREGFLAVEAYAHDYVFRAFPSFSALTLLNATAQEANVTLTFFPASGGDPVVRTLTLAAGRRTTFVVDPVELGLPPAVRGGPMSPAELHGLRYTSSAPISVEYSAVDDAVAAQTLIASQAVFPLTHLLTARSGTSTLSVFNPGAEPIAVRLIVHDSDGEVFDFYDTIIAPAAAARVDPRLSSTLELGVLDLTFVRAFTLRLEGLDGATFAASVFVETASSGLTLLGPIAFLGES